MYYDGGDRMSSGAWIFMAVIAIVAIGLLVVFVVWLIQDQRYRPHIAQPTRGGSAVEQPTPGGSAIEILDRRLATGEIGVEEYERVKVALSAPIGGGDKPAEPPATP